jgi:hypothetical protein
MNPNPGTISGKGISPQDFLALKGDLIAMASDLIFAGADVTDIGIPGVLSLDLLDLAGKIGLNLVQNFDLSSSGLVSPGQTGAELTVGDGSSAQTDMLTPGVPLTIQHASSLANSSGNIDMALALVPQAKVKNQTSVGADVNGSITVLAFSLLSFFNVTAFHKSGGAQIGTFPPVYNKSFNLQGFNTQTVHQTV